MCRWVQGKRQDRGAREGKGHTAVPLTDEGQTNLGPVRDRRREDNRDANKRRKESAKGEPRHDNNLPLPSSDW